MIDLMNAKCKSIFERWFENNTDPILNKITYHSNIRWVAERTGQKKERSPPAPAKYNLNSKTLKAIHSVPTDDVVSRVFIESSALEQMIAIHPGMAAERAGFVSRQAKPEEIYY
ncbi:hypothetical protein TNCV_277151 [Trichonephila clavipes]|uniref:Uncharacterized protein n=1 Tax=Trichonephila clavipes TaxID=2585209 RepID=A0A8X6S9A0_TRICX|nr:hypothetical protein TNCV_277151 [Trichonephila clavipes]